MIKKLIIYILLGISFLIALNVHAGLADGASPEVKEAVSQMVQLPEARVLLQEVEREGPIQVNHLWDGEFNAYWDTSKRTIVVNLRKQSRSKGSLLQSIIFELHNAKADRRLNQIMELAKQGKLDRETYVKRIECTEYQNVLAAAALLDVGIKKGVYPPDCALGFFASLEEHLQWQKKMGHSAYLSQGYDELMRSRAFYETGARVAG
jgi:hypothetical protein